MRYINNFGVDPGLCRPLYAMFLTDAFIHEDNVTEWDREKVLSKLLEREERHLRKRQNEWLDGRKDKILEAEIRKMRLQATILNGAFLNEIPN